LPLYYSPYRQEGYADQIRNRPAHFEIIQGVTIRVTDDVEAGLQPVKESLALYVGGMGAESRNFHNELMARMGFEAEAKEIQSLFLSGKKDEAVAAVPTDFADEISLVGPIDRIKARLEAWQDSPVTSLLVSTRDVNQLRQVAELVLG
jgi:alkanesulfonate monooxygenase SsuD/methylene tetrahydromethanopterin reductase-like flavin-dependent oxidoreductase (luciferase family)